MFKDKKTIKEIAKERNVCKDTVRYNIQLAKCHIWHNFKWIEKGYTGRKYDETILDRVDEYLKSGFTVFIKCSDCGNVHELNTDCQVCDKKYNGYI